MIELHTFKGAFGEPSASPFCAKAMCLLQLSGVEWAPNFAADVRKAPMGKLPVIVDGDQVIADSSLIMAHLERKYGAQFYAGLTPREWGEAHAFSRMAEEHLVFALTYNRWVIEKNWLHLKREFFDLLPLPLRGFVANKVRKGTISSIIGQGMGRFDEAGVAERVEHDLRAIAGRLDGAYLFGDEPTAVDCFLGPLLSSFASLPETTVLRERVREDAVLYGYVERFRDRFYRPLEVSFKEAA